MTARPTIPTLRPRRRGAFTLIELMVTMAVILIVAGVAMPSILRMIESTRQTRTRNLFRGLINNARAHALVHNTYAGYRFQRSPRDNRLYAVLIYHDPARQSEQDNTDNYGTNNRVGLPGMSGAIVPAEIWRSASGEYGLPAILAFYAVPGVSAVMFPEGTFLLQDEIQSIASPYEFNDTRNDDDLRGDLDAKSTPAAEPINNACAFSIIFDPKGQPAQIWHIVRRIDDEDDPHNLDEDKGEKFDSIFNEEDVVFTEQEALLQMDEKLPSQSYVLAEMSQIGAWIVEEKPLRAARENKRWTDFVKLQPRWRINLYNGQVVDIKPPTDTGS